MPDIFISKKEQKNEPEITDIDKTINPLSGVRFETQEEEEKIVLLLRMHWLTNVPWVILAIILLLAPSVLRFFPLISSLPPRYQLASLILWYLLLTAFVFERFLTWFFNVYIITDERIVDIDFYNLLYKEVSDAKIDKIQDITYKMGGAIRAIFNFGDVFIQTAGTEPNFEFRAVPRPDRIVKILQELRTEEEIEALEGRIR